MPKNYFLSRQARHDLKHIVAYIAQDNPPAAEKMKANIEAACRQLCDHPSMGQVRDDLTAKKVRFWPVHPNYMIVYDPATMPVQILRIIHSARHTTSILQ